MGTSIKHIETPEEWKSWLDYGSHRPLLYLCLTNIKPFSTVIEFGSGFGSTPLVRDYCQLNNLQFYSFDTDNEWCDKVGSEFVHNFANIELKEVGLLFIDGKPGEQRKDLVDQHRETASIIIVHDTEPGSEYVYGMTDVLKSFKYRIDFTCEKGPHTTALSNKVNIEKWISHQD